MSTRKMISFNARTRCSMILLCALLIPAGICLLVIALWYHSKRHDNPLFQLAELPRDRRLDIVSYAFFAVGCLAPIAGSWGVYGAVRRRKTYIRCSGVLLLLLATTSLIASGCTMAYRAQYKRQMTNASALVRRFRSFVLEDYTDDSSLFVTAFVDRVQTSLRCCGDTGWMDWKVSRWKHLMSSRSQTVPESCCVKQSDQGESCSIASFALPELWHLTGCQKPLRSLLGDHRSSGWVENALTVSGFVSVPVLLLTGALASVVACSLRSTGKYDLPLIDPDNHSDIWTAL